MVVAALASLFDGSMQRNQSEKVEREHSWKIKGGSRISAFRKGVSMLTSPHQAGRGPRKSVLDRSQQAIHDLDDEPDPIDFLS